jgi:16S rRNA G966 N2-methylase RsmD
MGKNWQALNTILSKYKDKVQTIYIDPPFNKDQEADYLYNVKFKKGKTANKKPPTAANRKSVFLQ